MELNSTAVKCAGCSAIIDEDVNISIEQRAPSHNCGSTNRLFEVRIDETVTFRDALSVKARHGTGGQPFYEGKSGPDFHRATGRWMQRDLTVDRENDRFVEHVIDPNTGETIHSCEEPLSEHRGHGNAKKKIV
jgi:hypothetical protein